MSAEPIEERGGGGEETATVVPARVLLDGGAGGAHPPGEVVRIALLGNPNTGKTTLFNRISGLRHKTSNFPGTTLDARVTRVRAGVEGGRDGDLIDLPGIYSLELDQLESRVCREVLAGSSAPRGEPLGSPEVLVIVVDATNLGRNLMLVGEAFRRRIATVVVVNMVDLAARQGVSLDAGTLAEALGCEVVKTNARSGDGIDDLRIAIRRARVPAPVEPIPADQNALRAWADRMYLRAIKEPEPLYGLKENRSDKLDKVLLHPVLGAVCFALVMLGLFYVIFTLAQYPMGWIEAIFGGNDAWVAAWQPGWLQTLLGSGLTGAINAALPAGVLRDLLADGVVAGVGSTVVFLPQICLLFFLISLLEDTGYLARASFVMDRVLRPFGLPGQAFVPLLSSHACALPGIMAARSIPDVRQRLATILVAPFMTCSARLPVYVLLTSLLFPREPLKAALAFTGCYALGMVAGVLSALVARRTILRGKARPMAMELPSYKRPSLRTALLTTWDRGSVFLRKAGTFILALSIVLWWLGEYPKARPPAEAVGLRSQAEDIYPSSENALIHMHWPGGEEQRAEAYARAETLHTQADQLEARHQAANSFMGRIGRAAAPVFSPMDYDWRICIGVMTSFAAREVFVATMAVVISGSEVDDAADEGLIESIKTAKRDDGVTPVFTAPVAWSLLVFYVLAMQCLPTLAVTAREAGGFRWAVLQFAWMSGVAYVAAWIAFVVASAA